METIHGPIGYNVVRITITYFGFNARNWHMLNIVHKRLKHCICTSAEVSVCISIIL